MYGNVWQCMAAVGESILWFAVCPGQEPTEAEKELRRFQPDVQRWSVIPCFSLVPCCELFACVASWQAKGRRQAALYVAWHIGDLLQRFFILCWVIDLLCNLLSRLQTVEVNGLGKTCYPKHLSTTWPNPPLCHWKKLHKSRKRWGWTLLLEAVHLFPCETTKPPTGLAF